MVLELLCASVFAGRGDCGSVVRINAMENGGWRPFVPAQDRTEPAAGSLSSEAGTNPAPLAWSAAFVTSAFGPLVGVGGWFTNSLLESF